MIFTSISAIAEDDFFYVNPLNPLYLQDRVDYDSLIDINLSVYRNHILFDSYEDIFQSNPAATAVYSLKSQNSYYLRGLPLEKFDLSYNGIPINHYTGSQFDFQNFIIGAHRNIIIDKDEIAIDLTMLPQPSNNDAKERFASNIIIRGGNKSAMADLAVGVNVEKYYFSTSASYETSSGYDLAFNVPNTSRESSLSAYDNTAYEKRNLAFKAGIIDENSRFELSYLHINNLNELPNGIYYEQHYYSNQGQYRVNSLTLKNVTKLNYKANVVSTINYNDFKTLNSTYDDSTYSTAYLPESYPFLLDNYSFGASLRVNYSHGYGIETGLNTAYKRQVVRATGKSALDNELEELNISVDHLRNFSINFLIRMHLGYTWINPLVDANLLETEKISDLHLPNLSLNAEWWADEYVKIDNRLSYRALRPLLQQYLPVNDTIKVENAIKPEKLLSYDFTVFLRSEMNILAGAAFYVHHLDNAIVLRQREGSITYENKGEFTTSGIEFSVKYDTDRFLLGLGFNYFFKRREYLPQNKVNLTSRYSFDFGLEVMAEFVFSSKRLDINHLNTIEAFGLVNAYVKQRIYGKYVAFISINNALNEYYERGYGIPGAGLHFSAGVDFELF